LKRHTEQSNSAIARMVKLADNAENMDLSRIAEPTERDFAKIEEYKKSQIHFA
jgi:GTP diphosphokinase / guanosine-3',5'-bis(diphosphate) 3'-diphosphatase